MRPPTIRLRIRTRRLEAHLREHAPHTTLFDADSEGTEAAYVILWHGRARPSRTCSLVPDCTVTGDSCGLYLAAALYRCESERLNAVHWLVFLNVTIGHWRFPARVGNRVH